MEFIPPRRPTWRQAWVEYCGDGVYKIYLCDDTTKMSHFHVCDIESVEYAREYGLPFSWTVMNEDESKQLRESIDKFIKNNNCALDLHPETVERITNLQSALKQYWEEQ